MERLFKEFTSTLFSHNSSPVILIHISLIAAVKAEKKNILSIIARDLFS
tara:strand:- start:300 stop:446 length:147 start_codon:yes stop_codon:yes gene_type:complete